MRAAWLLLAPMLLSAQDFEHYRLSVVASGWLVDTSGTVQSGVAPIHLRADLGVEQRQPTFTGRLDIKPGRRWHLLVEGTPYRLSGHNTLERTVVFRGQQYSFRETVDSTAEVNYVFGGVEYDLLHRGQGHLGLFGGGAYVDATATLTGLTTGITATEAQRIGLPLAGLEVRAFPIPGSRRLLVDGNVQGMSFGGYGRFVKAGANAGVFLTRFLAVEAGYTIVDADLHSQGAQRGVAPRFTGPVFSLRLEH